MNAPAPNIPCTISATSPFTEYMKKIELEATRKMIFVPETRPSTLSLLRISPLALVVAQHWQAARQQRRKKGMVILMQLEQWQPSLLSTMAS